MRCASVPQMDVARTRASTSFGPGSGTGISWISRTFGSSTTRPCIVSVNPSPTGSRWCGYGPAVRGAAGARAVSPIIETRGLLPGRQGLSIIDGNVAASRGRRVGDAPASGAGLLLLRLERVAEGRGEVRLQQLADRQLVGPGGL